MKQAKSVVVIGFDPSVVDYSRWPGLDAEKLRAALGGARDDLNARGYNTEICYIDLGRTAEAVVKQALSQKAFDCVLIGAGVRTDPDHFLLFEKLINVVHQHAATAKICFNTNPSDTAAAIMRWV
jgi:hypothetical protein